MTVKRWIGAVVSVAFLSPISSALAADGFYVNVMAGVNFLQNADNTGGGITLTSEFEPGFGLAGAGGYKFSNGIRLEGELGYRRNALDRLVVTNDGGVGVALGVGSLNGLSLDADDEVSALSFMVNGFYDFDLGSGWMPYVGGGVGLALVDAEASVLGVTVVDDDDTVFAYQIGAGIGYVASTSQPLEEYVVTLDYRYFATADPSLTDAAGGAFDSEFSGHYFGVGMRFQY